MQYWKKTMDVVINENDLKDLFCIARRSITTVIVIDHNGHLKEDIDLIEKKFLETKNRLEKCLTLLGEEIETNRNLMMKLVEMQEEIEILQGKEIL